MSITLFSLVLALSSAHAEEAAFATSFSATDFKVAESGAIVGAQFRLDPFCNPATNNLCIQFTNNTNEPVQVSVSYEGAMGPEGVNNALVSGFGTSKFLLTQEGLVSIFMPGEIGYMLLSAANPVTLRVTRWSMPGLGTETVISPDITILGDWNLYAQGMRATKGVLGTCTLVPSKGVAWRVRSAGTCG